MITLIQLEYIIAVDTYRHFAKAAQKCFVTQPTLSMQIKKLEEHLGITIFDRSRQPVMPTEIGKKIIEQSRIILRESEKIPQIINSFDSVVSGELKIGVIPTIGPYLFPEIINDFMKKYPAVSLHIKEMMPNQLHEELKKDLIDIGIIASSLKDEAFVYKSLFYEEIMIYVNQHYVKTKKESITTQELDTSEMRVLSEGHSLREHAIRLCTYFKQSNSKVFFKYESGSLEALVRMVDNEGGYTLLPELALKLIHSENKNKILKFKNTTPLREVMMVSNKHFGKSRLSDLLFKHIKHSLPKQFLKKERGIVMKD
ncbi:MAG: LysR substrate-binding domain-containing protein [Bacteroidota bacterium]